MPARKKLPDFATDEEAEDFVASADLTTYDLSGFVVAPLSFAADETRSSVSLPSSLVDQVRLKAEREGISADQFIRRALERAIRAPAPA